MFDFQFCFVFRLYFMHRNFTDVRTVKQAEPHLQYKLEGLGTYGGHNFYQDRVVFNNLSSIPLILADMTSTGLAAITITLQKSINDVKLTRK